MAPNIKKLNLLASSLQDLDIHVQPKYLPLTHPQEEAQQTTTHQEHVETRTPASDSASYWDWPADVPEDEEPPKDLFSASALEANLIKDSQREASTDIIYATDVDAAQAESDDYWSERVEEPEPSSTTTATNPQHDTYWSWPADPQDARIKAILEDERVRGMLSAQHIVDNLVNSKMSGRSGQTKPESDSYWTWDSLPTLVVSETLDEVYSQAYWEWKEDDSQQGRDQQGRVDRVYLGSRGMPSSRIPDKD